MRNFEETSECKTHFTTVKIQKQEVKKKIIGVNRSQGFNQYLCLIFN